MSVVIRKVLLFLFLTCAVAVMALSDMAGLRSNKPVSNEKINRQAERILQKCEEVEYRPECYDKVIPDLMKIMPMEDVFKVISQIQKKDASYPYCHVVAHKLSFLESKKRPGEWSDIMYSCPLDMCDYGCQHGAMVAQFRGEELLGDDLKMAVEELKGICDGRLEWNPPFLVKRSCYHGLGHIAMYVTGGDLNSSLSICADELTKDKDPAFLKVCTEGVFMTVLQGIDPEDMALVKDIKPEPDGVSEFCSKFEGLFYQSCMRESHSFSGRFFRESVEEALKFCSYTKTSEMMKDCMAVVAYIRSLDTLEAESQNFLGSTFEYCNQFELPNRTWCYEFSAYGLLEVDVDLYLDRTIAICNNALKSGAGDECFNTMVNFSTMRFHQSSPEAIEYCKKLPEKWKDECFKLNSSSSV